MEAAASEKAAAAQAMASEKVDKVSKTFESGQQEAASAVNEVSTNVDKVKQETATAVESQANVSGRRIVIKVGSILLICSLRHFRLLHLP